MTVIANSLERDRAAARLDRLASLAPHVEALRDAVDHPECDPLLMDVGRYVGAVLDLFADDLIDEQETLRQLIAAWDASWRIYANEERSK